jgi:hypothetical protein
LQAPDLECSAISMTVDSFAVSSRCKAFTPGKYNITVTLTTSTNDKSVATRTIKASQVRKCNTQVMQPSWRIVCECLLCRHTTIRTRLCTCTCVLGMPLVHWCAGAAVRRCIVSSKYERRSSVDQHSTCYFASLFTAFWRVWQSYPGQNKGSNTGVSVVLEHLVC